MKQQEEYKELKNPLAAIYRLLDLGVCFFLFPSIFLKLTTKFLCFFVLQLFKVNQAVRKKPQVHVPALKSTNVQSQQGKEYVFHLVAVHFSRELSRKMVCNLDVVLSCFQKYLLTVCR